jgi:AraC family transcriptional regulator
LAKIAVEFDFLASSESHSPSLPARRELARGKGWSVDEVLCSAGPRDRAFEEQHSAATIAIVLTGSFQYRSAAGRELMTPGSLLLGNPGQFFECSHDHGVGDRCVSFTYDPAFLECLASESGMSSPMRFSALRLPPLRELSSVVARACAGMLRGHVAEWEGIGIELASRAMAFVQDRPLGRRNWPAEESRVTRTIRMIENRLDTEFALADMAREARLSRYHFLRVFQRITGLTPHRYLLRARLRRVATRLLVEGTAVLDIALDSGFGDISNFNHAFRAEFGVSPRIYRKIVPGVGVEPTRRVSVRGF